MCRIYPAEINPFVELTPMHKACPPGLPPLLRAGKLVDADMLRLSQQAREAAENDVPIKQEMCTLLGIDRAAMSKEGFAVYSPYRAELLSALRQASRSPAVAKWAPIWRFVSNRRTMVDNLLSAGEVSSLAHANSAAGFEYLGFSRQTE